MVENLESMICVFDVGRQRSDERSHVFVRKARNQFSWVAASGNYGSPRVVGLVDLVTYLLFIQDPQGQHEWRSASGPTSHREELIARKENLLVPDYWTRLPVDNFPIYRKSDKYC